MRERGLQKALERREREGWVMKPGKGVQAAQQAQERQEQEEKPPALPASKRKAPDLQEIREARAKTRRERQPTVRDYRSSADKRRDDAERRDVPPSEDDKQRSGISEPEPLDMDALREKVENRSADNDDQGRSQDESPDDGIDL